MVYCGKPSKACEACRKRRIKCNLARPTCAQCIGAQRQCAYRDLADSVFRDQSELVSRKARAGEAKKSNKRLGPSGDNQTTIAPVSPEDSATLDAKLLQVLEQNSKSLQVSPYITFSVDEQASCFFLKNYVLGNARSFDYLPSFYDSGMEEHLTASVNAVALATLSSEFRSSDLEKKALREYGAALLLTNVALKCSDIAKTDSTLVAVILLDLFEKVIHSRRNQLPTKSWTNHTDGLTALVRLRGYEQFQSGLGLRIFLQISSAITVSCMIHGTAVPADIVALRTYATNFLDADDPTWRISQYFVRFVNLCAALKDGTLFNPATIITNATGLDNDCIVLSRDIASKWQYNVVYTEPSSSNYEGYYHVYDNYRVVQLWNSVRLGRLLLNEIIHKQYVRAFTLPPMALLSAEHIARFQLAIDNILEMASEICAAVPQFAGGLAPPWPDKNDSDEGKEREQEQEVVPSSTTSHFTKHKTQAPSLHMKNLQPRNIPKPLTVAGGYSILFPLFVVGYSHIVPDPLRSWIINRMNFIGHSMDIPQAHAIADMLERREDINVWAVYAMLGSYNYPDRQRE